MEQRNNLSTEEIDEIRQELGLSWDALAEAAGITGPSLKYHRDKEDGIPQKYQDPIIDLFNSEIKKKEESENSEQVKTTAGIEETVVSKKPGPEKTDPKNGQQSDSEAEPEPDPEEEEFEEPKSPGSGLREMAPGEHQRPTHDDIFGPPSLSGNENSEDMLGFRYLAVDTLIFKPKSGVNSKDAVTELLSIASEYPGEKLKIRIGGQLITIKAELFRQ